MARRRVTVKMALALAAFVGGAPLAGQSTTTNTTATPVPPQGGNAVGPPQLRDFTLNGTVTQPAQPTPAPAPAPRASAPTTTSPEATPPSGVSPSAPPSRTRIPARTPPAPRPPADAALDRNPAAHAVTVDLPPATTAPILPEPSLAQPVDVAPAADRPLVPSGTPSNYWPWAAALLAVTLGAAFLWWRRRQQAEEEALQAADHAELSALIAARDAAPPPSPRAMPPARPAATPIPAAPAPARGPASPPAPVRQPAPVPQPAPAPLGIVASGLKPRLELTLVPIGVATDVAGGAALTFDLTLVNSGSAPARDVLIEAQLINAGPNVDTEVGNFFLKPPASGSQVPMIAPMGRTSVRLRVAVPAGDLAPLIVEGRHLLVPIVAINALYRWSGGELTESSSFLVGRGDGEAEKLAPFRLDLGARSWTGLAARLHSTGLQR
jgi:hypothetical protein